MSTTVIGYPVGAYQVTTGNPYNSNSDQTRPTTRNESTNNNEEAQAHSVSSHTCIILMAIMISIVVFGSLQVTERPDFKVDSGTVMSRPNGTATEWDLTLLATNKVSFKTLEASAFYRDHTLALTPSPATPIVLNKKTSQHMKLIVTSGDVGEYIDDDRRSRGFMSFQVKVRACLRGNKVFYLIGRRCHRVQCGPLNFMFSHDGTATSLQQTQCTYF